MASHKMHSTRQRVHSWNILSLGSYSENRTQTFYFGSQFHVYRVHLALKPIVWVLRFEAYGFDQYSQKRDWIWYRLCSHSEFKGGSSQCFTKIVFDLFYFTDG